MKKLLSILLLLTTLATTLVFFAVPTAAVDDTFDLSKYDTDKEFIISTADDYISFFYAVNIEKRNFRGKTVKLAQDISFNNTSRTNWYEMNSVKELYSNDLVETKAYFSGVFDGQNHTLKGVYLESTFGWDRCAGLFPGVLNGEIRNLILDGFYICNTAMHNAGGAPITLKWGNGGTGALIGHAKNTVVVDNVTIRNGIVTTSNKQAAVGAVIGTHDISSDDQAVEDRPIAGATTLSVTNTVVEDTVEVSLGENYEKGWVGGIVGYSHTNPLATSFDFSASKFTPKGYDDATNPIQPWGFYGYAYNAKFDIDIYNWSWDYYEKAEIPAGLQDFDADPQLVDATSYVNTRILESKCYGTGWAEITDEYEITWVVASGTTKVTVKKGVTPYFVGDLSKPNDGSTRYEFKGWDKALESAYENTTYTAEYRAFTAATVTWMIDGTPYTEEYEMGETPECKEKTAKAEDDEYVYTFEGWDKTVEAVTQDVTYTAVYSKRAKYTITWDIDGEKTTEVYLEGIKPSYRGNVTKAEDSEYTYKFTGWSPEVVAANGDATYTAQFEKIAKNPTAEAPEEETEEKSGCKGTVSLGFVTVAMVGMAGAFVARKKKD